MLEYSHWEIPMGNLLHFLKKWPFGYSDTGDGFKEKLSYFKMLKRIGKKNLLSFLLNATQCLLVGFSIFFPQFFLGERMKGKKKHKQGGNVKLKELKNYNEEKKERRKKP